MDDKKDLIDKLRERAEVTTNKVFFEMASLEDFLTGHIYGGMVIESLIKTIYLNTAASGGLKTADKWFETILKGFAAELQEFDTEVTITFTRKSKFSDDSVREKIMAVLKPIEPKGDKE